MTEWKEYKLGEVAEITSSKRIFYSEYVPNGVPFYRSKEIIDLYNKRDVSTELFISEKRFKEISEKFGAPKEDDILLTSVGSLGIPYKVKPNDRFYFKDGNLTWFKDIDKEKLLPDYLMYWLSSGVGKQKLEEITIGSTQAAFTISGLKTIIIEIPSINTQRQITSILTSLDDKIDLLRRENATLEAMAETLFRQWFVVEAKEEWEEGKLGDWVVIKRGGSPRPINDYIAPTGYRWLKISDVTNLNSPYIFQTKEYIKESGLQKTVYLRKGSLVLSNSATPGIPKILCVDSCIHDGWLYFPKSSFSKIYLYLLFKYIREDLVNLGNGSIFTNLKTDILKDYKVVKPDAKTLENFDHHVQPIFDKLYSNDIQIQTLIQTRDGLLPRLMSGEINETEYKL